MNRGMPPGLRFAIISRAFKRKLDERTKELDLTGVQMHVLAELDRLENFGVEEVNQRDLEQAEHVTHPTMTEIIKRLEKKGFVQCSPGSDRRYKKITRTPKAIHFFTELADQDDVIFQELCRGLTQQEIESLLHITDLILLNIARDQQDHK